MKKIELTQRDMELFIGKMLRVGVFTACGVAILGGIMYIVQNAGQTVDFQTFSSQMALHSFSDVINGVMVLNAVSVIQLGIVILLCTPILRVAFSAVAFLLEKDYLYVGITLVVLFIILLNLFDGEV
ncbi:MAG: DUF1634 domain-containing protein [Flavobacteriales bacterium]|nr:DUF1634 domain-containing protein [Flavobacteriales bacterium]